MDQAQENKKFILSYYQALSGKEKSEDLIRQFVTDEKLIEHIKFFDKAFPGYHAVLEELLADGDRVFARISVQGRHQGYLENVPPTLREIKTPFAICYKIENQKIVDHWMIADQMELMEQLGLFETGKSTLPGNWEKVEMHPAD